MERHIRYGRISDWVRIIAVIAMSGEVFEAIKYHFPLWDDIAMPLTLATHQIASFVQRYTNMYRVDV